MVPVIRDAGRLSFSRVPRRLQRARREGADEHADRRRPDRRQHLAHQPGRDRHDRLGPAADGRPGHDRRHRLDRLPGRASAGSAQAIGAEKVMTMTSTYDHRIIQGAESGRFLQRIEALPAGRGGLLRARVRATSASSSRSCRRRPRPRRPRPRRRPRPPPPRRRRAPRPTRSCCRRSRPRPRCSRPTARTATWPRSSTRSAASPRATRRSTPSRSG